MDYEKAYKDALERVRELALAGKVSADDILNRFPELAESDDERIRKDLICEVQCWEGIPNSKRQEYIAYLEKPLEQKPDLELIKRSWYMEGYTDGGFKREPMWNLVTGESGPRYEKNEKYGQPLEQKPAEWSDEDEAMLKEIISFFKDGSVKLQHDLDLYAGFLEKRLKSLRPQPRKEIYHAAKHDLAIRFMNYIDENRPEGKMSLSNGECEDVVRAFKWNDWAKIVRYYEKYRPHWKPGEEQMVALARATNRCVGVEDAKKLLKLLEQLESL